MIRNVRLKNFISNTVFGVISRVNRIVPKDDKRILLYANCAFRDNLVYLYDYLIQKGYNQRYRIIRSYQGSREGNLPEHVTDISNIRAIWQYLRSGHVYYAFGKLPIYPAKGQTVIQMWHGNPFKGLDEGMRTFIRKKPYYTYYFAPSEYYTDIAYEAFGCDPEHIAICGHPRTDVMFEDNPKYDFGVEGKKIVIWMPTYRRSQAFGYDDIEKQRSIVPFFTNEELIQLNEELKKIDIGLVVKIHPSQDLDLFRDVKLSHICVLSHEMFISRGYDLYRMLPQTSALITDYSSVFMDYLLINKPIAFTMEDFDEYKRNRGFMMDNPEDFMPGHKVYNQEDLVTFLQDVAEGKDTWETERRRVNELVNACRDGQNRKRALDISHILS